MSSDAGGPGKGATAVMNDDRPNRNPCGPTSATLSGPLRGGSR